MSHEQPDRINRGPLDEEFVKNKSLDQIIKFLGQIRGYYASERYQQTGTPLPAQRYNLFKLAVNISIPLDERAERLDKNQRVYYELLHDPRLAENGIFPEIEDIIGGEYDTQHGSVQMTSVRLGEEASLVRMTIFDDQGDLVDYRAQLWIPARSSEEYLFGKLAEAG